MSADAVAHVYRHSPYQGASATAAVLGAIADTVSDIHGWRLWMAQDELAAKARVSSRRVRSAIRQLEDDGWVREVVPPTNRAPAIYELTIDRSRPVVWEPRALREAAARTADRADAPSAHPPDRADAVTGQGGHPVRPGADTPSAEPKENPMQPKSSPSTPSPNRDGAPTSTVGEEEVEQLLASTLAGRLTEAQVLRLQRDPARIDVATAIAALLDARWPLDAIGVALTTDPLDDARSLARVLTARARHLATLPAPAPRPAGRPVGDCLQCDGTGWLAGRGAAADVEPCTCRKAA